MSLSSIRVKAIVLLVLIGAIPGIILITIGAIDIGSNIRREIQEDNLITARQVSTIAESYVNSAVGSLQSLELHNDFSKAVLTDNAMLMEDELEDLFINGTQFYNVAFIDENGKLIASHLHDTMTSQRLQDIAKVMPASFRNKTGISPPEEDPASHVKFVDLVLPYHDKAGNFRGVVVGSLSLDNLSKLISAAGHRHEAYAVIVDREGLVLYHDIGRDSGHNESMAGLPVMDKVKRGETGTMETYDPINHKDEYVAYWNNPSLNWEAIVEFDKGIMNDVMNEALKRYFLITLSMIGIVGVVAYHAGCIVTKPIEDIAHACVNIDSPELKAALPVRRKDEIGTLARSIKDMSSALIKSRNRAELYVDLMSHDINNMNQSVRGFIELSLGTPGLPGEARTYLEKALSSLQSSAGVIESVKTIQRVKTEGLQLESINLYDVVRQAANESLISPGKPLDITFHGETEAPVKGSPLLRDVFLNIMGNSIKYSGESVSIDITILTKWMNEREYYCVSFCDNGKGIPDDLKARLFRRYQRGSERIQGTGLGLYLVKNILESLGGWAEVRDRIPGVYRAGACFDVCLPAYEPKKL